jgi:ABC-type sulfate/molybdate transport systems ATPase subunit/ABC-type sulfate transport system permease component
VVADAATGSPRRRGGVRADSLRNPLPWLGALLCLYLIAPLAAFLVRSVHGAGGVPGLGGALATSVVTATISTAIIALLGVPLAYALARARGFVASLVTAAVALPLALPPLVSGILLLYLVGPYTALGRLFGGGLTDSRAGIVLAQTFVAAPFLVIAARAAFAGVDPELEAVARTLGYRRAARFLRVALPVAWPGIQAGLLLSWLRAFGEFGATVIVAYHPYSLPVYTFVQFDSTGVSSTLLPIAAALGAALVVLAATLVRFGRAKRKRRSALMPQSVAPLAASAPPLRFSLRKRLDGFELSLSHVSAGRRLALLGPSGAGKTLTLRALAGIARPDVAEISMGERSLHSLEPEERGIGYLPQHSALMPGRTVWQQVTFGVDADPGVAAWWLEHLGLAGLEQRMPDELSGGQQRRVALARALARNPQLLLLDEPFSSLDTPVRSELSRKLRAIQRDARLSTVLVTHDPEEAALLADEVIVIDHGRALQQGRVEDVFARPASPQVAALLGIANTHPGTVVGPGRIRSGRLEVLAATGDLPADTEITWAIRPELISVNATGSYRGQLVDMVSLVGVTELTLALDGVTLRARRPDVAAMAVGTAVGVELPPEAITVWPACGV